MPGFPAYAYYSRVDIGLIPAYWRKAFLLILPAPRDCTKASVLFCSTPVSVAIISRDIDIAKPRN